MFTLASAITILSVVLSMAFFTLMERKMMGYSQLRKGPNKVSLVGITQPIADAIKLLMKEWVKPIRVNRLMFLLAPTMMLTISLMMWAFIPVNNNQLYISHTFILFLVIMSLNIYPALISGWVSNSKYASIGALRAIAQTISYEITMAIVLISALTITMSFNSDMIMKHQKLLWALFMLPSLTAMWLITAMAETNRTPFDLIEGESELVSGFNVEYSSSGFTMIFMAEYINILLMSLISATILMGAQTTIWFMSTSMLMFKTLIIAALLIIARCSLPRLRYDYLMELTWTMILPVSLIMLMNLIPMMS